MWFDEATGLFVFAEEVDRDTIRIFDVAGGAEIGEVPDDDYTQLKPKAASRSIGSAFVRFQLSDHDPGVRAGALDAI